MAILKYFSGIYFRKLEVFLDDFCGVVENWAAVGDNWPNNNFVKQKLISGFSANERIENFDTIVCFQQDFFDVFS